MFQTIDCDVLKRMVIIQHADSVSASPLTLSLPFMQKGSSSNHPEANDLVRVQRNTKPQGRDVAFEGPGTLEVLNEEDIRFAPV